MSEASDWESLKEVAFAGDLSENKVENNSLAKNLKQKIERARRGENVVLTLEDVSGELQHSGEPIAGIEDLIAVHKTNYMPHGRIATAKECGESVQATEELELANGEKRELNFEYYQTRNTVHFCLNSQVESHAYGNWDDAKYAVYVPLATNKAPFVAGTECDIFTEGGVTLGSDATILCPASEIDDVRVQNPGVCVIGYDHSEESDPTALPFANHVVEALGYKYQEPTIQSRFWNGGQANLDQGSLDFDDLNNHEKAMAIFEREGWKYCQHNGSEWSRKENRECFMVKLEQAMQQLRVPNLAGDWNQEKVIQDYLAGLFNSGNIFDGYSFIGDIVQDQKHWDNFQTEIASKIGVMPYAGKEKPNHWEYKEIGGAYARALRNFVTTEQYQNGKTDFKGLTEWFVQVDCKNHENWDNFLQKNELTEEQIARFEKMRQMPFEGMSDDDLEFGEKMLNLKLEYFNRTNPPLPKRAYLFRYHSYNDVYNGENQHPSDISPACKKSYAIKLNDSQIAQLFGIDEKEWKVLDDRDNLESGEDYDRAEKRVSELCPSILVSYGLHSNSWSHVEDDDLKECQTLDELYSSINESAQAIIDEYRIS